MTTPLFDAARRDRLRALGWAHVGDIRTGCWHWRDPDGLICSEASAFAWLESQEPRQDEETP